MRIYAWSSLETDIKIIAMLQKISMVLLSLLLVLFAFGQEDTSHQPIFLVANHITLSSNVAKAKYKTDSINVIANYNLKGSGFKNFLIGKNYRREWIQSVKVPVLNFGSEMGGFIPLKEGGGKQTRSIHIQDLSGKQWTLRSVEKFPINALPADLRNATAIKDLVTDGISASYPFV